MAEKIPKVSPDKIKTPPNMRGACVVESKVERERAISMGEVIYLHKRCPEIAKIMDDDNTSLSPEEIKRLESIRDNIEELLHMVAGLRRDPNAVALAAARFGIMRMTQLYGRAYVMEFANRCVENMELAECFKLD